MRGVPVKIRIAPPWWTEPVWQIVLGLAVSGAVVVGLAWWGVL